MPKGEKMLDSAYSGWWIASIVLILVSLIVAGSYILPSAECPAFLHRADDGTLRLEPSGQVFEDMNAFKKWWHSVPESQICPIPPFTGSERKVRREPEPEQLYATTPINKVDDYEFSRIFGYERNGRMEIPPQNFNLLMNKRSFDWPDKPLSSDERRAKYMGLKEGFTASGELKSYVMSQPDASDIVKDAVQQFGGLHHPGRCEDPKDREVDRMVKKVYQSDPDYEPVVTKVGANHWEVNELRPRRRHVEYTEPVKDSVVDTGNDAVDIAFQYREKRVTDEAIDPYFSSTGISERQSKDYWYGPVPGMERMFGPTFDHKQWY